MADPVLFLYEKCSTCRQAVSHLTARGVSFRRRGMVESTPTVDELRDLWKRSGLPLRKLYNTSGRSYRALDRTQLDRMDDEAQLGLLAADGMLIKRPLLDTGAGVLVGFDADRWDAALPSR